MADNKHNTLHKDIELIERGNNGWDINFNNGDLVKAEDKNSLRTGATRHMKCSETVHMKNSRRRNLQW